jgi:alpha-beta hydrolase superfamily lysophospholipase
MQYSRENIISAAMTTICTLSVGLGLLYGGQRRLIWAGQRRNGGQILDEVEGFERLAPEVVYCMLKSKKQTSTTRTYVYFHGNGDQIGRASLIGDEFTKKGHNFVAIEYPGYGLAEGQPTEESVYRACSMVLRHLVKTIDSSSIILVGQSIGCTPALEMSRRGYGSKLVLISPFLSMKDMASVAIPCLAPLLRSVSFILRDALDNSMLAPAITVPILVFHGNEDSIVPYKQGKALSSMFRSDLLTFVTVEGAGHNDVIDRILDRIIDF